MVRKKTAKTTKTKTTKPAKTTWQKFEYRCRYKWLKANVEEQAQSWKKVRDGLLKLNNDQVKSGEFSTANESMESAIRASLYATVDFGVTVRPAAS